MRIIYLIITSSLMICLMLLFRRLFRNKLSANVIYTLWLIVFFRLLMPFGYWEMPVFGAPAEIVYRPMAIVEQFFKEQESESIPVYEEAHKIEIPVAEAPASAEGIKIYDSVIPETAATRQELEPEENNITPTVSKEYSITRKTIILSIWFTGCMCAAAYVILQNLKLRKKIDEMDVIEQIDGIDICISKDIKTPCLFGLWNPKIIVTEEVLADPILYKYAVTHELEHYHHKDHIYNADRISMCILYWWNPLVWYAAKCVSEDAELACDERVLKNKSTEERKSYGYALIRMIENAQNKPLCFATSFSGNKNSAKQRIEAITRKTKTRKYILFPVALVLIVLLAVGCVFPSNKSYISTNDWENGDTEELNYHEAEYEYSLQDEFQSMLIYFETYEYGELTERSIRSYGDLEKYSGKLLLRNESYKFEDKHDLILEMNGIGISMQAPKFLSLIESAYAVNLLHSEKGYFEVNPGDDLILMAYFFNKADIQEPLHSFDCKILSSYTEDELKDVLKDNYMVSFIRLVLSDKSGEELHRKIEVREYSSAGTNTIGHQLADEWAKAFIDKDAETIINLATEDACQRLIENAMLDEEMTAFGWSSPWPMFSEKHYKIIECDNKGAEILYYAMDSTPHVYVWKEKLEFAALQDELKISDWSLERYDVISELEEYRNAYPGNQITDTPMDYYTNGLGEALNKNALLSSSEFYKPLFDAGSAALELLNVSKDYSLVHYITRENENDVDVDIQFLNENGSTGSTSVTMWQPYGESGIWIPKGEEMLSLDEYNEKYSKKEFIEEPEEKKVCLAVMPDGISRAGGDYRYIIPEDQVKWTDHYKQARSLVNDGAWREGERSAGIWIVFNDEWTCITDQGMIFDFDKRAEKEEIKDFYNLCLEEAKKYGTGTPVNPENFPEIVSATLNYNGAYTVTDESVLKDLRKVIYTSKELRGGSACPFTASLVLELKNKGYETIYLATDSCSAWLTDGVYYEYFGYENIEEIYDIFKRYGVKMDTNEVVLKSEND